MSRLTAGTRMSDSRWAPGSRGCGPSREVGMMRWARWCAAVTIASLVGGAQGAGAQGAQGSGGTGERGGPAKSRHTVVTNDMLLQAASSGDWLMYGQNYWNN